MEKPLAICPADIDLAASRIAGSATVTPLVNFPVLDAQLGGCALLKLESLQIGGSFKFRGAYNRLSALSPDARAKGVVAGSTGNHAQGIGHAAKRLGMQATIVMPSDAPKIKTENTLALGCEIVPYNRMTDDRDAIGRALAAERGCVFVSPFDDPYIIAGQGTIGLEILAQTDKKLDMVLICCGGGGLSAGIGMAIKHHSPATQIVLVEPEGYDDTVKSLKTGIREGIAPDAYSICDAISTRMPGELTFPIHQAIGSVGVVVSDDEVRTAMRYAFNVLKLVIEPGGAVALAAILSRKVDITGKNVAIIVSGGNVDADMFADIISKKG